MTLADLRRRLEAIPAGSLLPRDWLLDQLEELEEPAGSGLPALADLSVEEAGEILGRSPSTVREYCRQDLLRGAYRQRGREWRIPREAIRAFQRSEASAVETAVRVRRSQRDAPDLGGWREELEG